MGMTIEERLHESELNRAQYKKKCMSKKPKFHGFRNLGKETEAEFMERMEKQKESVRKTLGY